MELTIITGLVLGIVNVISAKQIPYILLQFTIDNCYCKCNTGCESGYYADRSTCVHCSQEPSLVTDAYQWRCFGSCSLGNYGQQCSYRCSNYCKNQHCKQWTGKCIYGCYDGWYGDTCNKTCSPGCIKGTCERDGSCKGGCKPRYYGPTCRKCPQNCQICHVHYGCEECKPGYYGKLCESTCQNCNQSQCDFISGRCILGCTGSWIGERCNDICPYDCISCNAGVCGGCKPGHRGVYCNMSCSQNCETCHQHQYKCLVCQRGTYGLRCHKFCNTCKGNECDIKGNCLAGCKENYYGNTCDKECNPGCRRGICDYTTGTCTGGCSNFILGAYCNLTCSPNCVDRLCEEGPTGDIRCTAGCVEGWWGPSCAHHCLENCLKCLNDTGMCEQCTNSTYGYSCSQTCNDRCVGQNCDIEGVCREGCIHGWMGTKCHVSTFWFLLPGSATVVLLVVCLVACLISRKQTDTVYEMTAETRPVTESVTTHELIDSPVTKVEYKRQQVMDEDLPLLKAENFVSQRSVSTRVLLGHFRQYVRMLTTNEGIIKQYNRLPINPVYPCYEGNLSQSVVKNRYGNILPYDYNRVVLDRDSATLASDYINASYIKGYAEKETFIATQGPFSEVVAEFWTMIWQKNVSKIVMLTNCVENNRRKCEQYWPNIGQAQMITPGVIVECLCETVDEYFTVRTFILNKGGKDSTEIKQFHFTTWPDCDVPDNMTSLLSLHKAVTTSTSSVDGPIVVHCSAGVGRTGTYIALDYLIQQAKGEGEVDVFECVLRLRHQRMNLVQTEEQYMLLHNILLQAIDTWDDSGVATFRLCIDP